MPWLQRSVTLILVDATGVVHQAKTDSDKRALLDSATRKDLVLVAWPGQWGQDIYVVDDLRAAHAQRGGVGEREDGPHRAQAPRGDLGDHRGPAGVAFGDDRFSEGMFGVIDAA